MRRPSVSKESIQKTRFPQIIQRKTIRFLLYKVKLKYFRKETSPGNISEMLQRAPNDSDNFIGILKQKLRERFFVSDLNRKEFYINLMTSLVGFDSIMDDADSVHENKFKVSGAEPFSFGENIDWHLDFKSGKKWPRPFYTKIDPHDPGLATPWELCRFHQAIWLGKAYWVSHSETHAQKFADMVGDWIDKNPVGYGVNWVSSTEVAVRAMNLVIGLMYFIGSDSIDNEIFSKLLCSLYDHGTHIYHNLENQSRPRTRYISNIVGLLYLGVFFSDTTAGKRWLSFARRELESEIPACISQDGTCHEVSVSRHAFTAEMLSAAYVLLKLNGIEPSGQFKCRLEKMFEFLTSATMPDGKLPNVGASDDGLVFKMRPDKISNDCRDLFAVAAAIFKNQSFKSAAGGYSELALMLLGAEGFEQFSAIKEDSEKKSAIFPQGGFAFLKTRKDYCSFNFGGIGKQRHEYNSALSFTIAGKNRFIVDHGTYCDSRDKMLPAKMHSAYSYNTGVVDRTEQVDPSGRWFARVERTPSELLNWLSTMEQDIIEARNHRYERLPQPIIHERKVIFNKQERTFIIEDNFMGEGKHEIELMFHFAPEVRAADAGRNFLALEGEEFALLKFQHPFALQDWKHSPGAGALGIAKSARVDVSGELPIKLETFIFMLGSYDEMNYLLNHIS